MENWKVRKANPDDISFIYATWLKSYHYDSWTRSIAKSVYFDNYKLVIDRLLNQSEVLVACHPTDENVILGYCVFEPNLIHYMFIKEAFRRFGIATDLIKKAGVKESATITHKTQMAIPILRRKDFIFNPFILYKGE